MPTSKKSVTTRRVLSAAASHPTQTKISRPAQNAGPVQRQAAPIQRGPVQRQPAQEEQTMNEPLPFKFMTGDVRIYRMDFKTLQTGEFAGEERLFVYYQEVDQQKYKQSFKDKNFIDVLQQLEVPANYRVAYNTIGGNKELIITPT